MYTTASGKPDAGAPWCSPLMMSPMRPPVARLGTGTRCDRPWRGSRRALQWVRPPSGRDNSSVGLFEWLSRRPQQPETQTVWHVRREGDEVVVEDGRGAEFRATVR